METYEVKVEAILRTTDNESFETTRFSQLEVRYEGIPNDRHFGHTKLSNSRERMFYPRGTEIRNRRQISVLSVEDLEEVAKQLNITKVKPEWLGANILISGFEQFSKLPWGARIMFPGGVGLYCEGENHPCKYPGEIIQSNYPDVPKLIPGFVKAAFGRRGIVCSVEHPGILEQGVTAKIMINNN